MGRYTLGLRKEAGARPAYARRRAFVVDKAAPPPPLSIQKVTALTLFLRFALA